MTFSQEAWQRNLALYQATLNLPFNQELARGILNREAFCHYVIQDAHYLEAYGRALAVCGAKAFDAEGILQFAAAAQEAIVVERSLHNGFMQKFGISTEQFAQTPLTAACHHYTSYLISVAWSESYPVVLAVLLPCFWIYAEVGKNIVSRSAPDNPYQAWIDTYAGEEFHESVRRVIATVDHTAAGCSADTLQKMHHAYTTAAKLEWLFWDSAYRRQTWPGLEKYQPES
ncbi:MAG: thiaminase II [Neisseria sp.]|uniref:thiaminase II n=1 Tax=Neisseria sp. TaxID=192066 RepID=UPI0026DAC473|nr:thiaminase II [Neisseria sp.]MDO4641996.1 thiaminase II [Neisseria sp.]